MKKQVAVIGATGIAGQQFLVALADHPWFEIVMLAASERSAGKTYGEALRDPRSGARRWWCLEEPPAPFLDLRVENADGLNLAGIDMVFTAVESDAARVLEPQYARTTPVLSTASAFRYEDDVPIMVPGVNPAHAGLIERQRRTRGWGGFIAPLPNCTAMGLVVTLKPLLDRFGVQRVLMTSGRRRRSRARPPRSSAAWTAGPSGPRRSRSAPPARGPRSATGTRRRWRSRSEPRPPPPTWLRRSPSSARS